MQPYIVEYEYETPLTDELHDQLAKRIDPCLAQYGVEWRVSFLAVDRMRMFCHFEAESAEQIRNALRSAGAGFSRVWPALRYAAR
ncbi:MAG: DUF4242 domain-containing protein [Myxococcales bacterium]|nr:DUF4242 domain-containing protein [Myxococcales bacterium]